MALLYFSLHTRTQQGLTQLTGSHVKPAEISAGLLHMEEKRLRAILKLAN
jgi:hypothetical protein